MEFYGLVIYVLICMKMHKISVQRNGETNTDESFSRNKLNYIGRKLYFAIHIVHECLCLH